MAQAVGPTYTELTVGAYTIPVVIVPDAACRTLPPAAWAIIPAGEFPIILERAIANIYVDMADIKHPPENVCLARALLDFPADQE